jgi:hypothetical protein
MSGGRAEDQSTSNVTPLNPERAPDVADTADAAGKAPPAQAEARDADEATSGMNGDLQKQLKEARELLFYASDEGIEIKKPVIETIVSASEKKKLTNEEVVGAIMSIASLSKTLKDKADKDIRPFIIGVVALGMILVLVSTATFLAGSYSKVLTDEIAAANKLALDVNAANVAKVADSQMRDAPIADDTQTLITLQQFAASIRGIFETSHLLRRLVFASALDMRQLNVGGEAAPAAAAPAPADGKAPEWRLLELRVPATYGQIKEKTEQFQAVRAYARMVQDTQTAIYGALTNAILPSLYAILGVCAFLLKTYAEQVRAHTFKMSWSADSARFIIAAIGGGVVGLFSNFTATPDNSLSLLAVAFLIGYATDIFFTFLDGLEQAFMKGKSREQERKSDSTVQDRT